MAAKALTPIIGGAQKWLLPRITASTASVAAFQRAFGVLPGLGATSVWANVVFRLAAALGDETFFILFLPWLFWDFDVKVARHVILLWCASYYICQGAKDLLALPRPPAFRACHAHAAELQRIVQGPSESRGSYPALLAQIDACRNCSPGVVKLEHQYATEFGFPSTHTNNCVSMPFYVLYLCAGRYTGSYGLLAVLMTAWCVLCSASRLYLGVHSIPDIIGGAACGAAMLALHIGIGEWIDAWILDSPLTTVVSVCLLLLIASTIVYPRPSKPAWVSSPGDTTLIAATACGVCIAANLMAPAHKAAALQPITPPGSLVNFATTLPRLLFGFGILLGTRSVGKGLCMAILPRIVPAAYSDADDETVESAPAAKAAARGQPAGGPPGGAPVSSGRRSGNASRDADHGFNTGTAASSSAEAHGCVSGRVEAYVMDTSGSELRHRVQGIGAGINGGNNTGGMDTGVAAVSDTSELKKAGLTGATALGAGGRTLLPHHRNYWVELPTKMLVYSLVGFNAVYTVPTLVQAMGWKDYGIPGVY